MNQKYSIKSVMQNREVYYKVSGRMNTNANVHRLIMSKVSHLTRLPSSLEALANSHERHLEEGMEIKTTITEPVNSKSKFMSWLSGVYETACVYMHI